MRRHRLFGLDPRLVEVTATETMPHDVTVTNRPPGTGGETVAPTATALPTSAGFARPVRRRAEQAARDGRDIEPAGARRPSAARDPGALVPTYSQLIEADVPEVLSRRLVRHVAESLEPDEFADPESIRASLVRGGRGVHPDRAADSGGRRNAADRGPGRTDRRRQDDDRRQARSQLQAGSAACASG